MGKDLTRRKFLERVGLGTAAGVSLSLWNELAEARPAAGESSTQPHAGAQPAQKFPSWLSAAVAAS